MIRVGAKAPAPPPISSPKPRLTFTDYVTGGRPVRVRQSGDLRDRVVQLARRKEERNENQIPALSPDRSQVHNSDRSHPSHTSADKQVTVVVYDLHKGSNTTTITRLRTSREGITKEPLIAGLHEGDEVRKWSRITLTERSPNAEHSNASKSPIPLPRSAAGRFRQPKPALPDVTVNPSPPPSPHHVADRPGRKVTIRSLRTPSKLVINQQAENGENSPESGHGKTSTDSSLRHSSENSRQQPSHGSFPEPSASGKQKQDRHGSPLQSSEGSSSKQTSQESVYQHPRAPPGAKGFNYKRAGRVLSSAHTPAPPSQEPTKRVRIPLNQEHRGPRPKSVKFRADECSSHYQSTGCSGDNPAQSSRPADDVQCEIRGNALPSQPQQSPVTSPRRHDNAKLANTFSASLEMFKRRLRLNQNRYVKDEGQSPEDEDYVIRLGDTKPAGEAHISHYDPHMSPYGTIPSMTDHRVPERRFLDGSGDDLPEGGPASVGGDENSDQRHFYRLSDSTEDLPFVPLGQAVPLPQVKTYVVEEDSKRLQGRGPDRPAALTQHNINLHNTLLQRRTDRERVRAARAECERRAGGGVRGGPATTGFVESPDLDARMKRWLLDTEHQRDFHPIDVTFKIAVNSP